MARVHVIKRTKTKNKQYMRIIYRKGVDHYYAKCDCNKPSQDETKFWDRKKIHSRDYCPAEPGWLTVALDPTSKGAYLKFPRYDFPQWSRNHSDMRYLRERFLREAKVCERISQNGHINLASYHGCIIRDGLVRAICYSGYKSTLEESVNPLGFSKKAFRYGQFPLASRSRVLQEIRQGIRHLHSLGLVHNDVKPSNIMLRRDGTAVVIDFDSCVAIGESLARVGRTEEWHNASVCTAQPSNDLDAIDEIEEWLSDREYKHYRF